MAQAIGVVLYCVATAALAAIIVAFIVVLWLQRRRAARARAEAAELEAAERRRRKRKKLGLRSAEVNAAAPEHLVVAKGAELDEALYASITSARANAGLESPLIEFDFDREQASSEVANEDAEEQSSPAVEPVGDADDAHISVRADGNGVLVETVIDMHDVSENEQAPGVAQGDGDEIAKVNPAQGTVAPTLSTSAVTAETCSGADGDERAMAHTDEARKSGGIDVGGSAGATDNQSVGNDTVHASTVERDKAGEPGKEKVPPPPMALADGEDTCAVCLDDLEIGDRVRRLPCKHVFHSDCIRTWLRRKNACPCCCVAVVKRRKKKKRTHAAASSASHRAAGTESGVALSQDGVPAGSRVGHDGDVHVGSNSRTVVVGVDAPVGNPNDAARAASMTERAIAAASARVARRRSRLEESPSLGAIGGRLLPFQQPAGVVEHHGVERYELELAEAPDIDVVRKHDISTSAGAGDAVVDVTALQDRRADRPRGYSHANATALRLSQAGGSAHSLPRDASALDSEDGHGDAYTSEASSHVDEPLDVVMSEVRRALRRDLSQASMDDYSTDCDASVPEDTARHSVTAAVAVPMNEQ